MSINLAKQRECGTDTPRKCVRRLSMADTLRFEAQKTFAHLLT
jgi:hypothetical protein